RANSATSIHRPLHSDELATNPTSSAFLLLSRVPKSSIRAGCCRSDCRNGQHQQQQLPRPAVPVLHSAAHPVPHAQARRHGPQGAAGRPRAVPPGPPAAIRRRRQRRRGAGPAGGLPRDDESDAASCCQLLHGQSTIGGQGHGAARRRCLDSGWSAATNIIQPSRATLCFRS
ncbi:hypothetical protein TOPH_00100, partial [Tolypocladium ophioglossoides CBS 100239]